MIEKPVIQAEIVPGAHERVVRVRADTVLAAVDPAPWRPASAAHLVSDFVAGFQTGLFTSRVVSARQVTSSSRELDGILQEEFQITLAEASSAPLRVLLAAAEASTFQRNGLRQFKVIEVASPELSRVGRGGLEPDPGAHAAFALEREVGDVADAFGVEVTFIDLVTPETFAAVARMFRAWGALLWGFPANEGVPEPHLGWGFVSDVDHHTPRVVIANGEQFAGSDVSWAALLRGLTAVGVRAPIERVEIY